MAKDDAPTRRRTATEAAEAATVASNGAGAAPTIGGAALDTQLDVPTLYAGLRDAGRLNALEAEEHRIAEEKERLRQKMRVTYGTNTEVWGEHTTWPPRSGGDPDLSATSPNPPRLLTKPMLVADIAKAFGIHRNTVTKMLPELGAEKTMGMYRIPVDKMPAEWQKANGLI